ncbi:MAG: hypothetical protein ACHQ7N_09570 [Candidatus Methylomirabilales bacterium]
MLSGERMKLDVPNRCTPFEISSTPSTRPQGIDRPSQFIIFLSILYPVLVYFGSRYFSPQVLALVLALLILGRRTGAPGVRTSPWCVAAGLLLAVLAFELNNALLLKIYPVLVNGSLVVIFGSSLRYPPTTAERIARLRMPDLPQVAVTYTRRVTQVWCVFFVGNGLMALWTALRWPDQAWFIYNGVIAYVLVAALFAGEWLVRQRVLQGHQG